jgi:signal transduction histidine kinase
MSDAAKATADSVPPSRLALRLLGGILGTLGAVGVVYVAAGYLILSRTQEMLTQTLLERSLSNVSRIAVELPPVLTADARGGVVARLEDLRRLNGQIEAILVLTPERVEYARIGDVLTQSLLSIAPALETLPGPVSLVRGTRILAATPVRLGSEPRVVGYVVYAESIEEFLRFRRQLTLVALGVSILGFGIIAWLLWGQVTDALANARLCRELTQYRGHLEELVEERTTDLRKTQERLLDASRRAGMAEIATGILHSVGNVLNSVNVSAQLLLEKLQTSRLANLDKTTQLLNEHRGDLGAFLSQDPRGSRVPEYLTALGAHLVEERSDLMKEAEALRRNIDHIKVIIDTQQAHGKSTGVVEQVALGDVVTSALEIAVPGFEKRRIRVVRGIDPVPRISSDRHIILQILLNLLSNARDAVAERGTADGCVTVRVFAEGPSVVASVADNGVGIEKERLPLLFQHGATTKKDGHGFGLHSSALAARTLSGSITVQSDGPGAGATFRLVLPASSAPEHP